MRLLLLWRECWCRRYGHVYPVKPGAADGAFARQLTAGNPWADTRKPCTRCGATIETAPKAA